MHTCARQPHSTNFLSCHIQVLPSSSNHPTTHQAVCPAAYSVWMWSLFIWWLYVQCTYVHINTVSEKQSTWMQHWTWHQWQTTIHPFGFHLIFTLDFIVDVVLFLSSFNLHLSTYFLLGYWPLSFTFNISLSLRIQCIRVNVHCAVGENHPNTFIRNGF